jgi:16S rRNA (adenine1518-N6/adenine1519-N6)-dimethyltransferase
MSNLRQANEETLKSQAGSFRRSGFLRMEEIDPTRVFCYVVGIVTVAIEPGHGHETFIGQPAQPYRDRSARPELKSPQSICRRYGLHPQRQLGQNFLVDSATAQMIVDRSGVQPEDVVVEIGPGLGALTLPLSRAVRRVIAIEKDAALARVLGRELLDASAANVRVMEADVLAIDLAALAREAGRPLTVLGNLPYNISSQVLIQLIAARQLIPRAVLMFQKELSARLRAAPGGRDYGRITAMLRYCAEIRRVATVTAAHFFPAPKVDSEVLEISFRPTFHYPAHSEERLFRLIAAGFGQRRKTLKNALCASELQIRPEAVDQALRQAGIDPRRRAETLSPEEFVALEISLHRLASASDPR